MKHLIVWSGGLDSTAVLLELGKNKEDTLYTVYFNVSNNKDKAEKEIEHRKILKVLLEKQANVHIINDTIYEYSVDARASGVAIWQPATWVFGLLSGPTLEDYDTINFGYIKGDCFWHVKEHFIKTIKHFNRLLKNNDSDISQKIRFPLEWYSKESIVESYYHIYPEIFLNIWTCENPRHGKPCGFCPPCETYDKFLHLYEEHHKSLNKEATLKDVAKAIGGDQGNFGLKKTLEKDDEHKGYR